MMWLHLGLVGESYALQGEVIGFRAAAGKDNFVASGADEPGNLRPGILNGFFGFLPVGVDAGWVAEHSVK